MNIGQVEKAMVGMAIFDMYEAAMKKRIEANRPISSPLVEAAFKAFESYIGFQEMSHSAMIQGLAVYALNPKGNGAQGITGSQISPFLALNVMA